MTDSEIKEAKELLKLQGFIRPKDFSTDLLDNASGPDSKLAILNNLSKKISPMESFAEWTLKPVINLTTNMGGLINKDTAKNVKKTYDLSFQAMKTQHPIASTAGEMAG
ncbi:MAG: hypothetical protein N2Z65_01440, partial [Clostridiales bacterium]|nr:hypothetical protein [Clostridiales bacterium]